MFYYYFRAFNWLCSLFGMKKPFLLSNGKPCNITYWDKFWSVAVIAIFIALDFSSSNVTTQLGIKNDLQDVSDANDLIFNCLILVIELFHTSKLWSELYMTFNSIFTRLKLTNKSLKMLSVKMYVALLVHTVIYVFATVAEFVIPPSAQYVLLIKFPGYLATIHLITHMHLTLAVLKVINMKLVNTKPFPVTPLDIPFPAKQTSLLRYFLDANFDFMMVDDLSSDFSINCLCKIYDDLITCIQLLEKLHGRQILCYIWLMFSSAVLGITLISYEKIDYPWMIIIRMALPFIWFTLCSYVDDNLRREVERTEILILKHLIDFKCDFPKKKGLETFKQLVSTNRLNFVAGNLFGVNYFMIIATIMNVITYTIIMIQLFISSK